MQPALLIRLRPVGPWRSGPGEGGRDHAEPSFGSDRLFSAVTLAMAQLGSLDHWLAATAQAASPAVAFSSLFPFSPDALYAPPPATLWPPPANQVTAPSPVFLTKLRWNAARLVPLSLVESILLGQSILADQWLPDPQTGCLLRRDRPSFSPFRQSIRTTAAVDRSTGAAVHVHAAACFEFEPGAGLWSVARFAGDAARDRWAGPLEAAFRLLADTGFGGRRSSGWGQTQAPAFQPGSWPGVLMPKLARRYPDGPTSSLGHWLLSLYSPSAADAVDWSAGDYALAVRGGFVSSNHAPKKRVRFVTEGSVLASPQTPVGAAVDVAPDGAPHPAYRSGFALSLLLPTIEIAPQRKPAVEAPSETDAIEPPCATEPETAPAPRPELEPAAEPESADSDTKIEREPAPKPAAAMPLTGEPQAGLGPEPNGATPSERSQAESPESEHNEAEPPAAAGDSHAEQSEAGPTATESTEPAMPLTGEPEGLDPEPAGSSPTERSDVEASNAQRSDVEACNAARSEPESRESERSEAEPAAAGHRDAEPSPTGSTPAEPKPSEPSDAI